MTNAVPNAAPKDLHRWKLAGTPTLAEAVAAFRKAGPDWAAESLALLYTPATCVFERLDAVPAQALSDAFEARIFGPAAELRWLRDPLGEGPGEAVLLTDRPLPGPEPGLDSIDTPAIVGTIDRTYLLWGRGTGTAAGDDRHSRLGTARIGTLTVPIGGIGKDGHAVLTALEYVAVETTHGNAWVVEERLTGLAALAADKDAGNPAKEGRDE